MLRTKAGRALAGRDRRARARRRAASCRPRSAIRRPRHRLSSATARPARSSSSAQLRRVPYAEGRGRAQGQIGPNLDKVKPALSQALLIKAITNGGASIMTKAQIAKYQTQMQRLQVPGHQGHPEHRRATSTSRRTRRSALGLQRARSLHWLAVAGERVKLAVSERTLLGSAESRRLRRQGLIPGVLYGRSEPVAIAIGERELRAALTDVVRLARGARRAGRRGLGALGDPQGLPARQGARHDHPRRPPGGPARPADPDRGRGDARRRARRACARAAS